ncbi:MAG: hypothetical protein ABIH00_11495 [Armatimonadota bacterium]
MSTPNYSSTRKTEPKITPGTTREIYLLQQKNSNYKKMEGPCTIKLKNDDKPITVKIFYKDGVPLKITVADPLEKLKYRFFYRENRIEVEKKDTSGNYFTHKATGLERARCQNYIYKAEHDAVDKTKKSTADKAYIKATLSDAWDLLTVKYHMYKR